MLRPSLAFGQATPDYRRGLGPLSVQPKPSPGRKSRVKE